MWHMGHEQDHPTQHVLKPCWEKGNKELWIDSNRGCKRVRGRPTEGEPNSAAISSPHSKPVGGGNASCRPPRKAIEEEL